MKSKIFISVLLLFSFYIHAQQIIKVRKVDNRFLFFQLGQQHDVLTKDKNDLFYIKLPDSLKYNLQINVENGHFTKTSNDTIFKLIPIKGMKYSHTLIDTSFQTLLEGVCPASSTIKLEIINVKNKKSLLQNKFLAK